MTGGAAQVPRVKRAGVTQNQLTEEEGTTLSSFLEKLTEEKPLLKKAKEKL